MFSTCRHRQFGRPSWPGFLARPPGSVADYDELVGGRLGRPDLALPAEKLPDLARLSCVRELGELLGLGVEAPDRVAAEVAQPDVSRSST